MYLLIDASQWYIICPERLTAIGLRPWTPIREYAGESNLARRMMAPFWSVVRLREEGHDGYTLNCFQFTCKLLVDCYCGYM